MANEYLRYLKLLNVVARYPSLETLRHVVRAHLATIPFENISKLIRWKTTNCYEIPSLTEYLDGVEFNRFGGTCYTNNYYLNQLLMYLGFDARLCGADMNRPDVHIVNMVTISGTEFLVDVGYAAPFLEPIPRNLPEDFVISLGADRYVLKPQDTEGRSRLEMYRNETLRHGYVAKPTSKRIEEFNQVIADSFRPSGTFMNALLIVRFDTDSSYVIHNMEFIKTHGQSSTKIVFSTVDELVVGIHDVFGMPPSSVRLALDGFSFDGNAWG
jgi:N-hydroxyarylamine O-acetyltransferase